MKWPWHRHRPNGEAARSKAEAEAQLRAERDFTRYVERRAKDLRRLPADEFADRVERAFRRRPA